MWTDEIKQWMADNGFTFTGKRWENKQTNMFIGYYDKPALKSKHIYAMGKMRDVAPRMEMGNFWKLIEKAKRREKL